MIRSQIYLTENERSSLKIIAKTTGRTQSDLIREAIDGLISRIQNNQNNNKRQHAFGMWQDHDDYPDITQLRSEFDRSL